MRSSSSPFVNPSGLVDKRLQPMWDQIEQVRTLLPQIAHVSYYLESLFNLDRNLTLLSDENVDHHILKDIQIFQGANAYEIAVAEGYVGNVSTWLASLVGPQGIPGVLDEESYQDILDSIAANAAAAQAAQTTANTAISTFANYVTTSVYNARVAYVDNILDGLPGVISDTVTELLPSVRTDLEIVTLAQNAINNSLINVNSALDILTDRLDSADIDLLAIQDGLAETSTAFGSFLIDYGESLTRLDVLEASNTAHTSSIISLQTVSDNYAADITLLQAASTTANSQILNLQAVTDDSAVQINNLQVSNNANFEAIAANTLALEAFAALDTALLESLATLPDQLGTVAQLVLSLQVRLDETRNGLADLANIDGVPIGAVIRGIRSAIVGVEQALATAVDTLTSRVNDNAAAIVSERLARTTAILAEASERSLLAVRLQNAEAAITAERIARTTANESFAQDFVNFDTQLYNIQTGQAGTANALTALTTRVRSNENQLSNQSNQITILQTGLLNAQGGLAAQSIAVASLDSQIISTNNRVTALSSSVTNIGAQVSGLGSSYSGLADALVAIEAAIISAGGSIDVSLSSITSLATEVAELSEGLSGNSSAISGLTSRMIASEGSISSVSGLLTVLTSQVEDLTSSLTIEGGTIADLAGTINSFYGIRGVAGSSEFEFAAMAPGGGAPSTIVLRADQISLSGDVIINGSLTTNQLADNAVTEKRRFNGSNVGLASNATFTNILSGNIPSAGNEVELEYQFDFSCPIVVGVNVEVLVNGSVVASKNHYAPGPFTHTFQAFADFYCPNNASLLIRVKAQRSPGVGQSGCSVSYVTARTIEFKR